MQEVMDGAEKTTPGSRIAFYQGGGCVPQRGRENIARAMPRYAL